MNVVDVGDQKMRMWRFGSHFLIVQWPNNVFNLAVAQRFGNRVASGACSRISRIGCIVITSRYFATYLDGALMIPVRCARLSHEPADFEYITRLLVRAGMML